MGGALHEFTSVSGPDSRQVQVLVKFKFRSNSGQIPKEFGEEGRRVAPGSRGGRGPGPAAAGQTAAGSRSNNGQIAVEWRAAEAAVKRSSESDPSAAKRWSNRGLGAVSDRGAAAQGGVNNGQIMVKMIMVK